ncbi:MAG: beta/gamma crystallin-related protein [Ideonella sp.]
MKRLLKTALALTTLAAAAQASAQVIFYENDQFGGRNFTTDREVRNLKRFGFNDLASSVVVESGNWEVCEQVRFGGRCMVLRPGRYSSLAATGLNDRISSVKEVGRDARVADNRYAPMPAAAGQIQFYEHDNFQGASITSADDIADLRRSGLNDRISSIVVNSGTWQLCDDASYRGRCVTLAPGQYPSLATMGLNDRLSSARQLEQGGSRDGSRANRAPIAAASATLWERGYFEGPSFKTQQAIGNFQRAGLSNRVQSAEIIGAAWEVCPNPQFGGQCMLLQPGRYPTLASMGMRSQIASVRVAPGSTVGSASPPPLRGNERSYEARVTSVRAVLGTPEQRCWVDKEQVERSANVPAAIAGALLGGLLGHQVGGGTGKDVATIGGVVAGAAIGSQVGRGNESQDVRRCDQIPAQARTEYWDVTYNFRGLEHRVQLQTPPGATVMVNERGEVVG